MIHTVCKHYCFPQKLLNRSSVPAKISVKRYFMLLRSILSVVMFWKFCHSMQIDVWDLAPNPRKVGLRPAPLRFRASRSSVRRCAPRPAVPAGAAGAAGVAAGQRPPGSPQCWCRQRETWRTPGRRAAPRPGSPGWRSGQSWGSSWASGRRQVREGLGVLQDRKLIRWGWN